MQKPIKPSSRLRILILDDDDAVRRVVSHALTQAGCEVESAANGRQGLRKLLTRTFDVAVVDIRMQDMDGLAFVQEAKKIWPWQGFVLISGFIDEEVRMAAEREGIQHLMAKPLDLPALVQAITQEARRMNEPDRQPPRVPSRDLIGYQLNIMRHITRDVLTTRDLRAALINLGQAITEMLPFDVMGILGVEKEETLLLLQSAIPQSPEHLDAFQQHIIARYQALSGRKLNTETLRIEHAGSAPSESDTGELKGLVSVPVMTGDEVLGILTLGSHEAQAFDEGMIAILYHAAGILSTLLTAIGEMQNLAIHDALTGVYNRRHLEEELQRTWNLSNRYKHSMAVLMMDIDLFKEINDRWGHRAGDDLLREFVDTLRANTRSTDVLARFGGDEFIIILPRANEQEATAFSRRILDAIRGRHFLGGREQAAITTSIGIAVHDPGHPVPQYEEMLHRADQALFRAKKFGRNTSLVWRPEIAAASGPPAAANGSPHPALGRILILDDEEYILLVLQRLLESRGYQVDAARTISEALDFLKSGRNRYDVLLCDVWLPDGDGLEVLRVAHELDPTLVNLVITGQATTDNAVNALRQGAYDFIQKPIIPDTLLAAIDRARQYRKLLIENNRYREYLEEMVRAKHSEVTQALDEIKQSYEFALETMVAMLDAREFETGQHSVRVRDLTLALARKRGYQGEELEEIGRGALLHDIGKIGIPDSILLKPGALNEDEWAIMRKHPEIGYRFLKNSAFLKTAAGIVLSHHERWDGTGYPHQLKEDAIDEGARIFAVIDAYDAMRSSRVYKRAIRMDAAIAEIKGKAGTQFDPRVVETFLDCVPEIEQIGRWST